METPTNGKPDGQRMAIQRAEKSILTTRPQIFDRPMPSTSPAWSRRDLAEEWRTETFTELGFFMRSSQGMTCRSGPACRSVQFWPQLRVIRGGGNQAEAATVLRTKERASPM